MKPILILFLKNILLIGITYGLFMFVFDLATGSDFGLLKSVYRASLFGVSMSLIFILAQLYSLKKSGVTKFTSDNLKVKQRRILKSKLTKQEIIEKLKNDRRFTISKFSENENRIYLETKMSFKSWGEKITITVRPLENEFNEYTITSRPALITTLADFGKNFQNVNRIEELIINTAL